MNRSSYIAEQLKSATNITLIGQSNKRNIAKLLGPAVMAVLLVSSASKPALAGMQDDIQQVNQQVHEMVANTQDISSKGNVYVFNALSEINKSSQSSHQDMAQIEGNKDHPFTGIEVKTQLDGSTIKDCVIAIPHPDELNLSDVTRKSYQDIMRYEVSETDAFMITAIHEAAHAIAFRLNAKSHANDDQGMDALNPVFEEAIDEAIADVVSVLKMQQMHLEQNMDTIQSGDMSPISQVVFNKINKRVDDVVNNTEEIHPSMLAHDNSREMVMATQLSVDQKDALLASSDSELIIAAIDIVKLHAKEIAIRANSDEYTVNNANHYQYLANIDIPVKSKLNVPHKNLSELTQSRDEWISLNNPFYYYNNDNDQNSGLAF